MNPCIYIGLDDTDNPESRGTGHLARALAQSLIHTGLASIRSITRHQLLVSPEIPYTSHNSAACLEGHITGNEYWVQNYCSDFLIENAASGSDVGLCIAFEEDISDELIRFGELAKQQVLTPATALKLATCHQVFLAGLTGKKIGVIGALAAVGLRCGGNDGRLLWMERLREIQGVFSVKKYKEFVAIDQLIDLQGNLLSEDAAIRITEWCRPVIRNKKIVLFAEKLNKDDQCEYQSASKEYIKIISG